MPVGEWEEDIEELEEDITIAELEEADLEEEDVSGVETDTTA